MPASERGVAPTGDDAATLENRPERAGRHRTDPASPAIGHTPEGACASLSRGRLLLAGVLHATLLAAAFPPLSWWPAAMLAPLPVLWVMRRAPVRPAGDALWVALGSIPFWAYSHVWIIPVTALGYPFLVLHLAAYVWLALWIVGRARQRWPALSAGATVPLVWTGVEFFRGRVLWNGYPWFLSGQPLIEAPCMAGVGAIGGVYAASLLVSLVCAATLDAATVRRPRLSSPGSGAVRLVPSLPRSVVLSGSAAGAIVIAGAAVELICLRPTGGPILRIAVVQSNVPQDNKSAAEVHELMDRWSRLSSMTLAAATAADPPDLIVWPESMFPGGYLNAAAVEALDDAGLGWTLREGPLAGETIAVVAFADAMPQLQEQAGVPLLVGAEAAEGLRVERAGNGYRLPRDASFNSAFLVHAGRVDEARYDKLHLTPFGEVMPYISRWDWLEQAMLRFGARGMSFNLDAGTRPVTFTVGLRPSPMRTDPDRDETVVRLATPICFEATAPNVCRHLAYQDGSRRADVLVNLTNDGWFSWFDPGREMHLLAARWRTAELATPMVRAANTGVSCVIDARGRVTRRGIDDGGAARVEGVMTANVPPPGRATPYSWAGDVVGWSALAGMAMVFAGTFTGRKQRVAAPAGR